MASLTAPKFALVTAGSAGLGAAIAWTLAINCGMSVVINYAHNATRAASLVEALRQETISRQNSSQQTFHAVAADLQQPGEVQRLVVDTLALTGGRLDAVVSNAGWTRMTDFFDLEQGVVETDWDRCFDVNVKGHLRLFHAVRHALEDAADGVFISTASVAGVKPSGSSLVSFSLFFFSTLVLLSHFFLFFFLCLFSIQSHFIPSHISSLTHHSTAVCRHKGGTDPSRQVVGHHRRTQSTGQLRVAWNYADRKCTLFYTQFSFLEVFFFHVLTGIVT